MNPAQEKNGMTSFALHLLAMGLMFCDHLWATVIPGADWLTWIGRIAFPIFAFLAAEGFFRTRDFKKYLRRMLLFALISEIPFNLMCGGSVLYPFHQNVIWTFVLALLCMRWIDRVRKKGRLWRTVPAAIAIGAAGFAAGTLLMTDYYGFGVLTVLLFYAFRGRKWWQIFCQIAGLWFINGVGLGGLVVPVSLFGLAFEFPQQGFAMLSMIPILLYRGKQGRHNRAIQYSFYAFYPAHMLLLSLAALCL